MNSFRRNYKSKLPHLSMNPAISPDQNKIYYESYETLDPIIY